MIFSPTIKSDSIMKEATRLKIADQEAKEKENTQTTQAAPIEQVSSELTCTLYMNSYLHVYIETTGKE